MNRDTTIAKINRAKVLLGVIPADTQDPALLAEKNRLQTMIDKWNKAIGPDDDDDKIAAMMAEFGVATPRRSTATVRKVQTDPKSKRALIGYLASDGKTVRPIEDQIDLLCGAIAAVDPALFDSQEEYNLAVASHLERFTSNVAKSIGLYASDDDGTADASPRFRFVRLLAE